MKSTIMKLVSIMLIAVMLFSGCGRTGSQDPAQVQDKGTVFMWEVTAKEGTGKVYLLGSIHAGRKDMYPLNDLINNAFEASDRLAVECDVTTLLQRPNYTELIDMVMYDDGTTLKDHIPADLYERTADILEKNGLGIGMVQAFKPFMIASMILQFKMAEWGYDSNNGIDVHFITEAKEKGMDVLEIESLESQYSMLGGFSDTIQTLQLKSAVDEELDASKEYLEQMFTLWTKGDAAGFEKLLEQEDDDLTADEKEAYADYEKQMFDDRNTHMAQTAEAYLKTGKTTFFVVGSAHMVGDTGIVKQLRDKGYTVIQK